MKSEDSVKDFMFEHSILDRIMLLFEKIIKSNKNISSKYIKTLITIIKVLIEHHHEKMEEKYVFPMITTHENKKIVDRLIYEHKLSKQITNKIIKYSMNDEIYNKNLNLIKKLLIYFIRMYRYHESYENIQIYPEFERNITKQEYNKINDLVEENEKMILGKINISDIINVIIKIEKIL